MIRLDTALLLKKGQHLQGRVLRVTSENSDYAPFEIKPIKHERQMSQN